MLEPRRLAARAAAERMAKTLGEKVGDTVGYRVRFGTKVSRRTRIEVVTEGVFTGLILDDPGARRRRGGAVRRVPRALARCRSRPRAGARCPAGAARGLAAPGDVGDDRRRAASPSALGDAPVIASEGRAFAVETRYLGRDPAQSRSSRRSPTRCCGRCGPNAGSILAFLPGTGGNPPHRDAAAGAHRRSCGRCVPALRRARRRRAGPRHRAGAARPAQGRAGDLDRGDLAHHRRRARGDRFRARPGAAL